MRQGDYIKSLLKDRNIKSVYVAEKMGISQATFSNKIHGNRPFKKDEIEVLLNILKMSYENVFKMKVIEIKNNCKNKNLISIKGEDICVSNNVLNEIMTIIEKKKEVI